MLTALSARTTLTAMGQTATPLARRAAELIPLFDGTLDPVEVCAPIFLAQVPAARVRAVAAGLVARMGRPIALAHLEPAGATAATATLRFERGVAAMALTIEAAPPGRITGLLVTGIDDGAAATLTTLDAVAAAVAALPGRSGFALADLAAGPDAAPTIRAAHAPDRALAIASTFKLVVLAALVRAVRDGRHRWDEATGGGPLRTEAEAMIRVSDNAATDRVLAMLRRERVEAMQAEIGLAAPAANRPFLTTAEASKLKAAPALAARYTALDEAGRRRMLAGEIAAAPTLPRADPRPASIDSIEWFATPADLVRVMAWFAARGGTAEGAEALRILALNPGLMPSLTARFAYAGYKGGSEPGVISMTLLLETRAHRRYVLTATWNAETPVDELRFAALVAQAARLLADEG